MEFVAIKDPHMKFGFRNKIRYDYEGDLTNKLQFIQSYMNNVPDGFILSTGDVFDDSYLRNWSYNHYLANVIKFEEIFKPAIQSNNDINWRWASIAGNHDYFNGEENIDKTIYGDFVKRGLIHHLDNQPISDKYCVVYGISYSNDHDKIRARIKEIADNHDKDKYSVIVLHQNVTPKNVPHITDFTYDELSSYDIDMFVLGHYHIGYEYKIVKDTHFINPWNLTRVSRDYEVKMDNHCPELYHINIDDAGINVKQVEIPHKSFEECFVKEFKSILEIKRKSNDSNFAKMQLDIDTQLNDVEIIEIVSNELHVNNDVKNDALKYMMQDSAN